MTPRRNEHIGVWVAIAALAITLLGGLISTYERIAKLEAYHDMEHGSWQLPSSKGQ